MNQIALNKSFLILLFSSSSENWLFMLDSSVYFVGYCLFIYELRQTMMTGLVDLKQTGPIK